MVLPPCAHGAGRGDALRTTQKDSSTFCLSNTKDGWCSRVRKCPLLFPPLLGLVGELCVCFCDTEDGGQCPNCPVSDSLSYTDRLEICPNPSRSKGRLHPLLRASTLKTFLPFFSASRSFGGLMLWRLGQPSALLWVSFSSEDTGLLQTPNTGGSRGPGVGREGAKRDEDEQGPHETPGGNSFSISRL